MACSLRYHRYWYTLESSCSGLPIGIISLLFVFVSLLPVLQHMLWRSASAPYARESREADRFRRELLFVLRHEESAASGTASTSSGADASWFRVDARQLDVGSPLPLLVGGETVGFLAGLPGFEAGTTAGEEIPVIPEEMLVMKQFSSRRLDELLLNLRKAGVPRIALKAVVTEQNAQWPFYSLYQELRKEHEAMHGGEGR